MKGRFTKYKFLNRLIKFLYLNRNRISGREYIIGFFKDFILLLPISLVINLLLAYQGGGHAGRLLLIFYYVCIIILFLMAGIYVKQSISRRHDLGLSGWFALLNAFSIFLVIFSGGDGVLQNTFFVILFLILICITGEKGPNKYGSRG